MKPEKRWVLQDPLSPEASSALIDHRPVLRQILFNRGLATASEAQHFLDAAPPQDDDPYLLPGMAEAVDRITAAIGSGESIAVYGDYDADGVTATALMVQTLIGLGAQAIAYIPNRFDEGYGLNTDALDDLKGRDVRLVISVDCGIRSLNEAEHAGRIGLDMIITDHHSPGPELPQAVAVVNPKHPDSQYPTKDLAGVGTAFKLAVALLERLPGSQVQPDDLLDLVALGTVADLVPLRGENRALVRAGLERIRKNRRQGLSSLIGVAGLQAERITAMNIGFTLGPRLNAAGRLDSALAAYHLLTTTDPSKAGELAQQLDNQNRERQQITRDMQQRADEIAVGGGEVPHLLIAVDGGFNPGVVGLAASRLTEQYYRPSIVGHRDLETTRASCRSIPEFDITAALDRCADLLVKYGGHAAAAGFTVSNQNYEELVERLNAIAREKLAELDLRPVLLVDAEVPFADLELGLIDQLDRLQPTGYGNPEPLFLARGLKVVDKRAVGKDASHLKLTFGNGSRRLGAIAFRMGHLIQELPSAVDAVFHFERNEYNGMVSPQMNIRDLRAAD